MSYSNKSPKELLRIADMDLNKLKKVNKYLANTLEKFKYD